MSLLAYMFCAISTTTDYDEFPKVFSSSPFFRGEFSLSWNYESDLFYCSMLLTSHIQQHTGEEEKKVLTTTTKQMNVRRFQKNDFYDFKALFMKWTHFKSLSSTLYNLKDSKWDEMKRQESRKILEFHVRDTRRH